MLATLVLLPGMDGTGQLFADFVAALSLEVKKIVVSYPADEALGYPSLEAPHLLLQVAPHKAAQHVEDFLRGVAAG